MKRIVPTIVLTLGMSMLTVLAQDDGGSNLVFTGTNRLPPPPSRVFAVLDANHDGVIDSNEIANASAALKTLDKNGDGQLTPDELYAPPPDGQGVGEPPDGGDITQRPPPPMNMTMAGTNRLGTIGFIGPPDPLIAALDTNHDGVIDSNEIANAPAALKTLDKNGNSRLTPDELFPPPPGGHRGGVSPGNPQGSTVSF
jgi:hypothetical protein